ncbi:hypothetical protein [Algoriphagus litoralis]|uniref:hypothetical protein n=1 Tax=Algoriphagus litoralis TaxID=2202829 RepID=UPI000DB959E9|nr:hypothetical protein [Algoriphagus litoralis]
MSKRDPVLTPELIKILKIFIFSSLGLVLVFSFFNEYRANNTGQDGTFRINDSNRLYFLNVKAIQYDREIRRDAGMTLYRHAKRKQSDSIPTLDMVILLNASKEEAYIYLELKNADWPIELSVKSSGTSRILEFTNGNNLDHFAIVKKLKAFIDADAEFELLVHKKPIPLWSTELEKKAIKSVLEDYFRLLDLIN